jgi:hypothetical protein
MTDPRLCQHNFGPDGEWKYCTFCGERNPSYYGLSEAAANGGFQE